MPTIDTMTTDVRSRVVEPTARFFTDAEVFRWINQAYHDYASRSEETEKVKVYPIVANVSELALPADIHFIQQVMWQDRWPVRLRDLEEWVRFVSLANTTTSDRPRIYRMFPWDGRVRLYPIPSVASIATTLTGAHNSSVTTLTVGSTTGLQTQGWVLIGTEQIRYFNTTATTLLNCVRGDGFTTPGTYVGAEPVTEGKLQLYYSYDPPDLVTGESPRIGNEGTEALIVYATAIAMEKKDKFTNAKQLHAQYEAAVLRAEESRRKMQLDRNWVIKDDEEEYFV